MVRSGTQVGRVNARQRKFAELYAQNPNATQSAIDAGYSARTARQIGQRLLSNVDVSEYIRQLQQTAENERIASIAEIKSFWSDTMRDREQRPEYRLKASELLCKAGGGFISTVNLKADVEAEISETNVVFYIPDNGRSIIGDDNNNEK